MDGIGGLVVQESACEVGQQSGCPECTPCTRQPPGKAWRATNSWPGRPSCPASAGMGYAGGLEFRWTV